MATANKARRRAVMKEYPPRKCSATSQRSGQPCQRYAAVGTNVCTTHGALAPQVKAAAERRLTLAEALANNDRRHPWEVIEHTVHVADVLLQDAIQVVLETGTATAKQVDVLVTAAERANRLAKTNLDADVDRRKLRLAEAQAGQMLQVFNRVIAALGLTPEQKAMLPTLLKREVEAVTRPAIEAQVIPRKGVKGR